MASSPQPNAVTSSSNAGRNQEQPSDSTATTAPETAAIAKPPVRKDEIYVDRLQITGNTRFSQQQLAAVVQTAIANGAVSSSPNSDPTVFKRSLTPAKLVQASEAITELYTKNGYIRSGAYVPAEVLNSATPEIRVVEGKLEAINVEVLPPKFLWFGQPLSKNYVRGRLSQSIRLPLQINQLADAVK